MSSDVLFKRASAIEEVKCKLLLFSDIMINGYQSIYERVPSFTTSILSMSEGGGNGISLGKKVIQAIHEESDEHEFLKEYAEIISTLSKEQQAIINDRYFNCLKFKELEIGSTMRASNGRIYKKLNEIYTLIACLDEEIEFDFHDYVEARKEDIHLSEEKKELTKIKEHVLAYIRPLLLQKYTTEKQKSCMQIIEVIPDAEKAALFKYFKEHHDFTSYDYRKVTRALYTFAFLHPDIEVSEDVFKNLLKRSGHGWKKYLEEVSKRSSSFAWKGSDYMKTEK